jgi:hypothetical protein
MRNPRLHCWCVQVASAAGHDRVVKLLLERGANAATVSDNGFSALMLAAKGGHDAVVRLLGGPTKVSAVVVLVVGVGGGGGVKVVARVRTSGLLRRRGSTRSLVTPAASTWRH